ncbi:MAG: RNA-binding S4 domain-containing protein [Tissierellia bacterium]|nr:RNA-binding S4 domain-containing protein [Bacillota bacterium]NLL22155.1 RNA-binding S4 domain-containing protein [Tissierellia bacterium]
MRIDKFLKVSRLIKRRTLAKEFCDAQKVMINGKVAKPSDEVKKGDRLAIRFGSRVYLFDVKELLMNATKEQALTMVEEVTE